MAKTAPGFTVDDSRIEKSDRGNLIIVQGRKFGPPNKRLVLNTHNVTIRDPKITFYQKSKQIEHTVTRINYLPTVSQTRLHTTELLYPGNYEITLLVEQTDSINVDNWFA